MEQAAQTVQQFEKAVGFSPDMIMPFIIVLLGFAGVLVLGDKVMDVFRKINSRRKMSKQDITDEIADKVMEKLQPKLDEKFADIDRRLSSDNEQLKSHTRQLNDHEERVGQLEGGNKALCHGMLALLERDPALVGAQKAMKNYLIDGTYKEEDWK